MRKGKAQHLISEQYEGHRSYRVHTSPSRNDASVRSGWGWRESQDDGGRESARLNLSSRHYHRSSLDFQRESRIFQPTNEREVKICVKGEAHAWGLQPGANSEHEAMVQLLVKETLESHRGDQIPWIPHDTSANVPGDFLDGISFLLNLFLKRWTSGGDRLTFTRTRDLVDEMFGVYIPYPPYNERSRTLNGAYQDLRLMPDQLGPLKRFSYYTEDAEASITSEWDGHLSRATPNHIAEAAAIHEVVNGDHRCLKCKVKAFSLNSKLKISFCDVVCKSCGSIYTFWGTSDNATIQKKFKRGHVKKGRHYGAYRSELKNLRSSSEMFVVFVTTIDLVHIQLYAGKITGASPALSSKSFNMEKIRVDCDVHVEPMLMGRPWQVISTPADFNLNVQKKLSFDAIRDYFGRLHSATKKSSQEDVDSQLEKLRRARYQSQVRKFTGKRDQIVAIKKKKRQGKKLLAAEREILNEEQNVLDKLAEFESLLRIE